MIAFQLVERRVVQQRMMAKLHGVTNQDEQQRMPHERDESTDNTKEEPSERMRQGKRDLDRGLEDTSRANEADQTYKKLKR